MNFNKILKSLFGDKSTRDMKLIQPLVEKVKSVYPDIQKLSNDELRAKSKEIQAYVQGAGKPYREKIAELEKDFSFEAFGHVDDDHEAMRFVCSWATKEASVDALIDRL